MNKIEKVKKIREITMSPVNKINEALSLCNEDVDKTIQYLIEKKQTDANDMANRVVNNSIVYSYVHNNRIGSMIVLSCQTDFVAKNEMFINLAKDICIHIISNPVSPQYIKKEDVPPARIEILWNDYNRDIPDNKPTEIRKKIIEGKLNKLYNSICLLNQPFIKDDKKTIDQIIKEISSTLGEKIEIKQFVKFSAGVI